MKLLFISNYFTHHQKPLCDSLSKLCDFTFLATREMTQERRDMGWGSGKVPDYVCTDPVLGEKHLADADVVILGSAPEALLRKAVRMNKLILRYSERPLKKGMEWKKYFPRLVKWHLQNPPGKRIYLLCASAYTAGDYAKFGLFKNRAFRWGYFPETKVYPSSQALLDRKIPGSILWTGRFLDWKRPGDVLEAAKILADSGYDFRITMIGGGDQEEYLRSRIEELQLQKYVQLKGFMPPEEVRAHMERSQIYLFTSDRQEGWGAVLNEAMNSGCAVIASDAAGSTPYLIEDNVNGRICSCGDTDALADHIAALLSAPQEAERLGAAAYETVISQWNGEVAARRLIAMSEKLLAGESVRNDYPDGPGSGAEILKKGWYKG